jgi:hypothetical protein
VLDTLRKTAMMNLNVGVAIPALRKQSTYKQGQGYSVKYQECKENVILLFT